MISYVQFFKLWYNLLQNTAVMKNDGHVPVVKWFHAMKFIAPRSMIMTNMMKKTVLVSLMATLAATPILADAHEGHGGGGGWWLPALIGGAILYDVTRPHYYQPDPYYYQPAPVYIQPQQVYVQPAPVYSYAPPAPSYQQAPAAAAQSWYYCDSAKGYYPYVKVCPGGWEQVPATPPAAMR